MSPLFLEPRLHPSIVKFFALIRLHAERSPRRGLLVNPFQPSYHLLAAFGFDRHNGLYRLFQEPRFSSPIVVLEGQGCRDLASLPIATVNVMATNDHGRNWCMDHSHGERGIWHNHCARVRACQMSGWLRRHSDALPTLSQVNAQRVLWQKRCDRLLDVLLCNHCKDEKDDAFAAGQGLDWIPDD